MSQHPNIVGLIDLFENSDYYYIVLEYMQGKDLFDYIQFRNFKLSEQRVKELSYQIGIAIKYLHSYGIVHRDLKLENVMMSDNTESSVPKLVDFGLAKLIGPNEKADEPFGTLGYVAPEVLRKEPYSYSCDLWSFVITTILGRLVHDDQVQHGVLNDVGKYGVLRVLVLGQHGMVIVEGHVQVEEAVLHHLVHLGERLLLNL